MNKAELAKQGTLVPGSEYIYKIGENQYISMNNPYNCIINTSKAFKTREENIPVFRFLRQRILEYFVKEELKEQGVDTEGLVITPEIMEKVVFVEPEEYIAMRNERERQKAEQRLAVNA